MGRNKNIKLQETLKNFFVRKPFKNLHKNVTFMWKRRKWKQTWQNFWNGVPARVKNTEKERAVCYKGEDNSFLNFTSLLQFPFPSPLLLFPPPFLLSNPQSTTPFCLFREGIPPLSINVAWHINLCLFSD